MGWILSLLGWRPLLDIASRLLAREEIIPLPPTSTRSELPGAFFLRHSQRGVMMHPKVMYKLLTGRFPSRVRLQHRIALKNNHRFYDSTPT